ncbi:hypothetical protein ABIE20_005288 [Pseudomonas sp. 2835]
MQIHCGPALPAMRPVQPAHQVASGLRALRTRSPAKPAPTGPVHADPLWAGLAGDEAGTASTSGGVWITSAAQSIAGKASSYRSGACRSIVGTGLAGDEAGAVSTSSVVWIATAARSIAGKASSYRSGACRSIVGAGLAGDGAGTASTSVGVWITRALRTRSLAKPAPTGPAHADPLWEPALPAMRPVKSPLLLGVLRADQRRIGLQLPLAA